MVVIPFAEISGLARKSIAPDGQEYQSLSIEAVKKLSAKWNVPGKLVEITALENGVIPERYQRNMGTIGIEGQIKLLHARVVIVGAGGLGGMVLELLARIGVGSLTIIDGDHLEDSNINRTILCIEENLGMRKPDVAIQRVKQINSGIEVSSIPHPINERNVSQFIKDANVIVDALGSISARFTLEKAAKQAGIPLVHGAIGGFSGQVMTIFPEDEGLSRIYGSARSAPDAGSESEMGTPATVASVVASFQAQEVIKIILGAGKLLRNCLLTIDIDSDKVNVLNL